MSGCEAVYKGQRLDISHLLPSSILGCIARHRKEHVCVCEGGGTSSLASLTCKSKIVQLQSSPPSAGNREITSSDKMLKLLLLAKRWDGQIDKEQQEQPPNSFNCWAIQIVGNSICLHFFLSGH